MKTQKSSILKSYYYLLTVTFLLLSGPVVKSQVCVKLPDNSVCGLTYSGYPASLPSIENTLDFNNHITKHIKDTHLVARTFNQTYGCNLAHLPIALESLRYQLSITCSEIVYDALENKGCETQASYPDYGPILCEHQCIIALNSVVQLFTNEKVCPITQDKYQIERNAFYDNMLKNCVDWKAHKHGNADYCVAGVQAEIIHCGFSSHDSANKGCALMNDPCCSKLNSTTQKFPLVILWIGIAILASFSLLLLGFSFRKKFMNSENKEVRSSIPIHNQPHTKKDKHNHNNNTKYDKNCIDYGRNLEVHHSKFKKVPSISRAKAPDSYADLEVGLRSLSPLQKTPSIISDSVTETTDILVIDSKSSLSSSHTLSPEHQPKKTFPSLSIMKQVIFEYTRKEVDELSLKIGDCVSITQTFSDGWAMGFNYSSLEKGIFPVACINIEPNDQPATLEIE